MTLPARRLVVTYGTFAMGANTNYVIQARDQPIVFDKDEKRFVFSCEVVVSGDTESSFKSMCAALETAFDSTNKNKLLSVSFNSNVHETFDPSNNTGFNARPSFRKPGKTDYDGPLSRLYVVRVELDLPYNESGKSGRRATQIRIGFTDSKRRFLTISGAYTALASNQAYAQYLASCDAFAGLVQTALGGVWEGPLNEQADMDGEYNPSSSGGNDIGKVLQFRREYQELIYNNSLGGVDARLRRAQLTVDRAVSAPGDYAAGGGSVARLQRLVCRYSAAVNCTSTQDLASLYEGVVKPFMLDEARKAAGTSAIAVTFRDPDFNRTQNTISAVLEVLAVGPSTIVRSTVSTQDDIDAGNVTVGRWSGKKFDKQRYQNNGTFLRAVQQEYEVISDPATAAQAVAGAAGAGFSSNQAAGFVFQASNSDESAIDSFFFGSSNGRSDSDGPDAGGVPSPDGLSPVFKGGLVRLQPVVYGEPGGPQIRSCIVTKVKRFEFVAEDE